MKRTFLFVMTTISLSLAGCQLETAVAISHNHWQAPSQTETTCSQWEQQILATTVRIQMAGSVEFDLDMGREPIAHESISHATIVGGRYLITHNHFKISPTYAGSGTSLHATLHNTANEMLAEAATFTVAYQDAETLVLEFVNEEGQGLFEAVGMPSAEVRSWEFVSLTPGVEVAQINWNGINTYVNCVTIEAIVIDEDVPRLELNSSLGPGASGGGIFWQGYHIGNNWQRTTLYESDSKEIVRQFSCAVLNPSSVVSPLITAAR